MDEKTLIRKRHLRAYIDAHGGNNAVARLAGVTTGYISHLASDERPGGVAAFQRLCERLYLPPGFFDGEPRPGPAQPGADATHTVPVYSWRSCGQPGAQPVASELAPIDCSFALRMEGDSMMAPQRALPAGAMLFVNATAEAKPGDVVIARLDGAAEATCRQLISDSGFRYLRAWNPVYPMHKLTQGSRLLGVVTRARLDLDSITD